MIDVIHALDVEEVNEEMVMGSSSTVKLELTGVHVPRIEELVRQYFSWAQVQYLVENVASMDAVDCAVMSAAYGDRPWKIDAGPIGPGCIGLLGWCVPETESL